MSEEFPIPATTDPLARAFARSSVEE